MKGTYLGEFEELVLLTAGILHNNAHGLAVRAELEKQTGRSPMISSVHKTLIRLEKKNFLRSYMGEATIERMGRKKRLYELTAAGKKVLAVSRELRNSMWNSAPKVAWEGETT